MFRYLFGNRTTSARMVDDILSHVSLKRENTKEIWGPLVTYEYNPTVTTPVRKITSMLVETCDPDNPWVLIRQSNELHNGWEWTSRPTATELTTEAAEKWLVANRFSKRKSPVKPR